MEMELGLHVHVGIHSITHWYSIHCMCLNVVFVQNCLWLELRISELALGTKPQKSAAISNFVYVHMYIQCIHLCVCVVCTIRS